MTDGKHHIVELDEEKVPEDFKQKMHDYIDGIQPGEPVYLIVIGYDDQGANVRSIMVGDYMSALVAAHTALSTAAQHPDHDADTHLALAMLDAMLGAEPDDDAVPMSTGKPN